MTTSTVITEVCPGVGYWTWNNSPTGWGQCATCDKRLRPTAQGLAGHHTRQVVI